MTGLLWIAPPGALEPDLGDTFPALPIAYKSAGFADIEDLAGSVKRGLLHVDLLDSNPAAQQLHRGGQYAVVVDWVYGATQFRYYLPAVTFAKKQRSFRVVATLNPATARSVSGPAQ